VPLAIYFGDSANYWMHLQAEYEIKKVKDNIAIQLSTIQTSLQIVVASVIDNAKPNSKIRKRLMR
jgi:plasmid maintenance system antidote protein VapI